GCCRLPRQKIWRFGGGPARLPPKRQQKGRGPPFLQRQPDEIPPLPPAKNPPLPNPPPHRPPPPHSGREQQEKQTPRPGAPSRLGRRQCLGALVPVGARRQSRRRQG